MTAIQDYVEKNDNHHIGTLCWRAPSFSVAILVPAKAGLDGGRWIQDSLLDAGNLSPQKRSAKPFSRAMINVELDPQGRLTYFQAIPIAKSSAGKTEPPQTACRKKIEQQNGELDASVASTPYDWNILF